MLTREEKIDIIERLKFEIEAVKDEIERRKQLQKRRFATGSLMRTGIVLLILAAGICVAGYFLL